eukprot:g198.t1
MASLATETSLLLRGGDESQESGEASAETNVVDDVSASQESLSESQGLMIDGTQDSGGVWGVQKSGHLDIPPSAPQSEFSTFMASSRKRARLDSPGMLNGAESANGEEHVGKVATLQEQLKTALEEKKKLEQRLREIAPKSKSLETELYTVMHHNQVQPAPLARSSSIGTQNELYLMQASDSSNRNRMQRNVLVEEVIAESAKTDGNGDLRAIIDRDGFLQDFFHLCDLVKPLLSSEPRVLELTSPTYVLGDIHGNMDDLRFFSEKLWTLGMHLTGSTFLFMGDYVDRGHMGIDVVLYLFAYKYKVPDKLFLLRGNHETRAVNGWVEWYKERCFLDQCRRRFGTANGEAVWEKVNSVFDCLPLAARIDESIFCVHGGIAPKEMDLPGGRIEQMKSIPVPLQIPFPSEYLHTIDSEDEQELEDDGVGSQPTAAGGKIRKGSPSSAPSAAAVRRLYQRLAFNLLWADPADLDQERLLANVASGFCQGYRGEDSVVYGENAVNTFLKESGCEMIMRAHEATVGGIKVCKQARVLTVFSTSKDHGVGVGASCACVLVDRHRVIVINKSPLYDEQFVQLSA